MKVDQWHAFLHQLFNVGHGWLLLKLILRQFGDLMAHPQEEFVDSKPAFGCEGVHFRYFGIVKMGEDCGLIRGFV